MFRTRFLQLWVELATRLDVKTDGATAPLKNVNEDNADITAREKQ